LIEEAITLAKKYIKNAYAPYSNFKVCAVLFGRDGFFSGVNVENASYGLSVCAERNAVFKAISEGKRNFEGILIFSEDGTPYPCGACRQVLAEFFEKDFKVIVYDGKTLRNFLLGELLPYNFKL